MANDGRSSMSNMTTMTPRTGAPPGHPDGPVHDTASGTVITAEIPAVRAGPSYGVLLPDGSIWYPGSRKRLPAPLLLRVVVWILAFAVFFAGVGDFIIHYHQSWVTPLRHVVRTQSPATLSSRTLPLQASGNHPPATASASGISPSSLQPGTLPWSPLTAYTVAKRTYTVSVTAGSGHPAWVAGQAFVSGQLSGPVTQQTLSPGTSLKVHADGTVLIHIGAGGTEIAVYSGLTKLATVPTPAHCPCFVLFEAKRH